MKSGHKDTKENEKAQREKWKGKSGKIAVRVPHGGCRTGRRGCSFPTDSNTTYGAANIVYLNQAPREQPTLYGQRPQ